LSERPPARPLGRAGADVSAEARKIVGLRAGTPPKQAAPGIGGRRIGKPQELASRLPQTAFSQCPLAGTPDDERRRGRAAGVSAEARKIVGLRAGTRRSRPLPGSAADALGNRKNWQVGFHKPHFPNAGWRAPPMMSGGVEERPAFPRKRSALSAGCTGRRRGRFRWGRWLVGILPTWRRPGSYPAVIAMTGICERSWTPSAATREETSAGRTGFLTGAAAPRSPRRTAASDSLPLRCSTECSGCS